MDRLSRETSTTNRGGSTVIAVMHAPWIAIESPTATSDRSSAPASTVRRTPAPSPSGSTRSMRPTVATMPVNMGRVLEVASEARHQAQIGTDTLDVGETHTAPLVEVVGGLEIEHRQAGTEQRRREVGEHLVDHAGT